MRLAAFALAALALTVPAAAHAGMPVQVKTKCAVGGEAFSYTSTASYSTFGSRPDGKPYGSWTFPLALSQCPGNGLVMYRQFTPAEMARLRDLIATADYRAMGKTDTAYYRAAWLERALKPGSSDIVWILLQASWEADATPSLRARYLREFAEAGAAALPPPGLDRAGMQLRIANAWRELGEFDRARALLTSISYDFPAPAGEADFIAKRDGTRTYVSKLLTVIDRKDASIEPLDMLPPTMAAHLCVDGRPADRTFCEAEPLATEVTRLRKARAPAGGKSD